MQLVIVCLIDFDGVSEVANTFIGCVASLDIPPPSGTTRQRGEAKTNLNILIPTCRYDDGVQWVRAEPHTRDPLSVPLVSDCEFAVSQRVPELDCPIPRTRNNLTVIGRERHAQDVVLVANKTAGSHASRKLPQAKSLVPRCGKSICAVRGDHLSPQSAWPNPPVRREKRWHRLGKAYTVRDNMRMPLQASLWNTITDIAIAGPAQVKRYREMSPLPKENIFERSGRCLTDSR